MGLRLLLALLAFTAMAALLGEPVLTAFILGIDLIVFGGAVIAVFAFAVLSLSKGKL